MRICFVGQGERAARLQSPQACQGEKKPALTVFGFDGGEVSFERELKGETRIFEDVAKRSKTDENLVVYGVITNTRGHRRKSAIVAENGRILGVSDAIHAIDGEVRSGAFLRVYDTKIGRVGVAVAEDIYDTDTVKTLAVCGCDFIVCPFERVRDAVCSVLLRAYAFTAGVPIAFCGGGYAMIADVDASIAFAAPIGYAETEFVVKKEFHLIESRRKLYLR